MFLARRPSLRSLVVASGLAAFAAPAQAADPPKLAVVVVIDQLSMAQIDRYEDLFGEGGFRRLLAEGSVARDAVYTGAPTVTAHGHATLATGSYADHHGIVGNGWWEHDAVVYVGHDSNYKLLTRDADEHDGTAPTQLRAPTFADALRWSRPGARVISLSLKDRGAILFGGAHPSAAVWFDYKSDRWTTSTYYSDKLPAWVPTGSVVGANVAWNRLVDPRFCALVPASDRPVDVARCTERLYETRAGLDDDPVEGGGSGFTAAFPHTYPPPGHPRRARMFMTSPLADEALFDLALKAVEGESLGRHDAPDLLFVSASAFDVLGHDFGPESQESLDALLREDAAIARLLKGLDEKVGAGRYVFALAADHGVRPAPLKLVRDRSPAGIVDGGLLVKLAQEALAKAFGPRDYLSPFLNETGFSFRSNALVGVDRARAESIVAETLKQVQGVADVFPRSLFVSHLALRGDAAHFARSYFEGRSPDFIVLPRPMWTFGDVASHGTSYLQDSRVPLFFYRGGHAPTQIEGLVDPASLTPTLALVMGSAPPEAAEAPILTGVVQALR